LLDEEVLYSCAVKVSVVAEYQASEWNRSILQSFEGMQHGELMLGVEFEHGSEEELTGTDLRSAIEVPGGILDQSAIRDSTVFSAGKAVKPFELPSFRDLKQRSMTRVAAFARTAKEVACLVQQQTTLRSVSILPASKPMQDREASVWGQFENRPSNGSVGIGRRRCPIQVAIGVSYQRPLRVRPVGFPPELIENRKLSGRINLVKSPKPWERPKSSRDRSSVEGASFIADYSPRGDVSIVVKPTLESVKNLLITALVDAKQYSSASRAALRSAIKVPSLIQNEIRRWKSAVGMMEAEQNALTAIFGDLENRSVVTSSAFGRAIEVPGGILN